MKKPTWHTDDANTSSCMVGMFRLSVYKTTSSIPATTQWELVAPGSCTPVLVMQLGFPGDPSIPQLRKSCVEQFAHWLAGTMRIAMGDDK